MFLTFYGGILLECFPGDSPVKNPLAVQEAQEAQEAQGQGMGDHFSENTVYKPLKSLKKD